MKILAMYLPQFHTFKENDEWWGKGFTEWTNTKKSKPLYKGHYQPKEPLNDNYYNLLEDDAKKWQANLAKQFGIDGFVFYHYWFNGKKLMEKPAEQLLENSTIDMNFCFSWANEPWTRSWDGENKEVIMPQFYGDRKDWKVHFEYLSKFFKDKRYIKIDNKPVLFIYRTNSIDNYEEQFKYWNDMAKEIGFNGIYIVETLTSFQLEPVSKVSSGVYLFEPMYTVNKEYNKISRTVNSIKKIVPGIYKGKKYILTNNYDQICKKIIKRNFESEKKVFYGFFPAWDNTSRRGINASIIEGSTPKKFGLYLNKLKNKIDKNDKFDEDYIIINAWNEWAEGAYLEPDKKNNYAYLEEIKKVNVKDK